MLAESIKDFWQAFETAPDKTAHQAHDVVEKDHGRLEVCRCTVFNQLDCLHAPERWPDLQSFAVVTTERTVRGKTSYERSCYLIPLRDRESDNSAMSFLGEDRGAKGGRSGSTGLGADVVAQGEDGR